jgi:ribosomal protein L19E
LASEVLKVGKSRVWLDPEFEDQLSEAITREDIRNLIDQKAIKETPAKGNSRGRAREQKERMAIDLAMDHEKAGQGLDKIERKNGCPTFDLNENSSAN